MNLRNLKISAVMYAISMVPFAINNICVADEVCERTAAQRASDYAALYRSTSDGQTDGRRRFVNSDVVMSVSESLNLTATAKVMGNGKVVLTMFEGESLENVNLPAFPLSSKIGSPARTMSYLVKLKNRSTPIQVRLDQVDYPEKKIGIVLTENYGADSGDIYQTQVGGEEQFRALILKRLTSGGQLDRLRKSVEANAKRHEEEDAQWQAKHNKKARNQEQAADDISYYQNVLNDQLQTFVARMRCYKDEEVASAIENLMRRQTGLEGIEPAAIK
jgi:hypothetical protein